MGELRDSSALFSLEGLLDLEKRRVEEARAAEQRHIAALRETELEQQRKAREAAAQKAREQERRRRRREQEEREEQARLLALREAEVQRARLEADANARIEILTRQQQHEQRLAAMRQGLRGRRDRVLLLIGALVTTLTIATSLGLYYGRVLPEAKRTETRFAQLLDAEREKSRHAEALLRTESRERQQLARELEITKIELASARGETKPPAPTDKQRPVPPTRPQSPTEKTICTGNQYDPLNGCLP